jgi:hypothetical protein
MTGLIRTIEQEYCRDPLMLRLRPGVDMKYPTGPSLAYEDPWSIYLPKPSFWDPPLEWYPKRRVPGPVMGPAMDLDFSEME